MFFEAEEMPFNTQNDRWGCKDNAAPLTHELVRPSVLLEVIDDALHQTALVGHSGFCAGLFHPLHFSCLVASDYKSREK